MRWLLAGAVLSAAMTFATATWAEETGRYQIAATTDDWRRAWRIDTQTGEVSLCTVTPDSTGCRRLSEGPPLPQTRRETAPPQGG